MVLWLYIASVETTDQHFLVCCHLSMLLCDVFLFTAIISCMMDGIMTDTMDGITTDMMDMETNDTELACPKLGDTWWVFLAVTAGIYAVGLLCCLLGYGLYRLIKRSRSSGKERGTKGNSVRKILKNHLRQIKSGDTIPGKILITVTFLCNLTYLVLIVRRSFQDVEICVTITTPEVLVELVLVCVLLIFSLVRFSACNNPVRYWIDIYTIVDVCTLFHIFITIILGVDWIGLRSLRFIWLTQMTVVLQFTPLVRSHDAVDSINLMIYFLVLWLTSSGIVHLIEAQGDFWRDDSDPHSFLLYVYLTMVTMSTVGYGDVFATTDLGRAFMIIFIIGGLAFFAAILPRIVELTTNYYARSQYAHFDTTRVPRHVIVCGHITAASTEDFLKDFLHPDRGDQKTHVLFLHPERPDQDLKNVLHAYYTRVQFLLGSVLNGNDLKKANVVTSSAIFILANKHTANPIEEDNANLLRVVSVKNTIDEIPIIIQLLHSFSKTQVSNIEGWSETHDIAVCLNELKLGLLAQSCLCPGFSTLVANLFYTSDFPMSTSFTEEEAWKEHYYKGASNEVYSSLFCETFNGMTFHQAASICYKKLNLVLLALEHIDEHNHHYYVNPSAKRHPNLKIESITMLGYFIAQDQCHVSEVSVYCECCIGNRHIATGISKAFANRRQSVRADLFKNKIIRPLQSDDSLDEVPINGKPTDEGDMIIHFSSSAPTTPCPEQRRLEENVNFSSVANHESDSGSNSEDDEDEWIGDGKLKIHIRDPIKLNEAVLNPDILSADRQSLIPKSDIKDHIILCLFANVNSPLLGLHNFLKPLRSKNLPQDSIKPVVIVCEKAFIEKEWPIIRKIPKVYLVEGSPLLWSNLKAARVTHCCVCVVLTVLGTSNGNERAIDDKEAILCSLSIQKRLKKIKKKVLTITDLRQESNVQFLDFGDEDDPDERIYKAQPFACGEAFSVSMFDSITSSVFHSPGTLILVNDLINSSDCQLVSLPVSSTSFSGRNFGDFYEAMLNEGNLCLGLSRKLAPLQNQSYCVLTCPDSTIILEENDFAFILAEK